MMTTIKPAHRIFTIATLAFTLAACGAKESSDTAGSADGAADGAADGGAADGAADGGAADGAADGGSADGAADGGSADGAADGGSADGAADGGTADGTADGTDGGTTTGGDAVRGEGLYSACSGCHGADGDSGYAPDLSVRVPSMTEAAIIGIVQTGRGGMPAIYTDTTDATDVTAYLIATWGG